MNQQEEEKKCIDFVRSIALSHFVYNDNVRKVNTDVFDGYDIETIVNPELKKFVYGLDDSRLKCLLKALLFAEPNERHNDFPDFIFEDWFIEHFQVSATKEKKGSLYERELGRLNKELRDTHDERRSGGGVIDLDSTEFTYGNLKKSILKHLKHHLERMDKYEDAWNQGCFVIEYRENPLTYDEERKNHYRMAKDVGLLCEIHQMTSFENKDLYIVFQSGTVAEIISCKGIPHILEQIDMTENEQPLFGTGIIHISIIENIGSVPFGT